MNGRVLVLGNTVADQVFGLPGPLSRDAKISADSYALYPGGQAANTAVALALLGIGVTFYGAFGDDPGGELCRKAFEADGVDLSGSRIMRDCPHHIACVLVSGAERSIAMYRDPRLSLDDLPLGPRDLDGCAIAYTDGQEIGASLRLAELARSAAIPLVVDLETSGVRAQALASMATHLVAPARVLQALAGSETLDGALHALRNEVTVCVVATMGSDGSMGLDDSQGAIVSCPAVSCDVVDTTGAGDAFHAGYVVALLRGDGLHDRLQFASAVAAAKCETAGPRLRSPIRPVSRLAAP